MTKKAFIVGNDHYQSAPSLSGCQNDAVDWNAKLIGLGFMTSLAFDATKTRMLTGLNWLVQGAQSGDTLVFCYSGHGSQVTDINGDELDGRDEVLCPVDWPQYISDDDLRVIFNQLPAGVNLDVFLDCCHSGTGTRDLDIEWRARTLPAIKVKKPVKGSKAIVLIPTLNHSLWAGCKDSEQSTEGIVGGKPRGLFTYYATKYIGTTPNNPRSSLMTSIQTAVTGKNPSQIPQLECSNEESQQRPFS